jgi:hypothetical protein
MKLLKIGDNNNDVKKWQYFLLGQQIFHNVITGKFDVATKEATIIFQNKYHLQADGIVGNRTTGAAMLLGFGVIIDISEDITSENFPTKPTFEPLASNAEREKVFGKFAYISKPLPKNEENIEVTDNWTKNNLVKVSIPQLILIKGTDTVYFHKSGATQLKKLWKEWETAGLLYKVLTWEGAYVPRFIRGSRTVLSNHAFGTAFDINYAWNKLGVTPALVGQKGCVRELVNIANNNGFYWGGHFTRKDGMHFEVAVLKQ